VGEEKTNSLRGKGVVITRAARQSAVLAEALQKEGALPVLMPMVAFAPPDDRGAVDDAIRGMAQYDWVFLTSQNALRALQERSESQGVSLEHAARASKIAAVGPATAEAARTAGLKVEYVAVKHQGTALAEELAEKIKDKSVLLPRSDRANPKLVEKLKALGARVKEVVAYKTLRPGDEFLAKAEQILHGGADAVLFFSPSAVHHFEEVLGQDRLVTLSRRTLFIAVGPVTEQALREAGIERVRTAHDTTVDAVLDALTNYFAAAEVKLSAGAKPQ
jgi:uroporphyrinogen-III synthase